MKEDGKRKIVVTSALPYANGDIHIGHLVEYLQTDFWVRYQRLRGNDCVYVCADDTHGTPVMIRARREGVTPEELIARSHEAHLRDFTDFQIRFDNYYTTNSPENRELSEAIFAAMERSGAVTRRSAPQLYCEKCSMFLPDRFVKGTCPKCGAPGQYGDSCDRCGATYAAEELGNPVCTTCGGAPSLRDAEHLYFELEPQHEYLERWIPEHTTPDVANKLLEWFREPLRGWCISRNAPYFGFEIPGNPGKFFYVWVDAPIGYIASLKNLGRFDMWNDPEAELYHFIGKDIIRFHCLFWPGMLHVAGFKGPDKVFVHGFLTVDGEKMSKSKGTFVTARTYLDHLPPEALRYYYAAKLGGTVDDIDLNLSDFVQRVNSDLVGKITNIASRSAQMVHKRLDGRLGAMDAEGAAMVAKCREAAATIARHYEGRRFSQAVVEICRLADIANAYFDGVQPWKTVKTDLEATRSSLTAALNAFRVMAIYLAPILPEYAAKAMKLFGEDAFTWDSAQEVREGIALGEYEYLASRIDAKQVEAMVAAAMVKPADSGEVAHESRASKNKGQAERSSAINAGNATGSTGNAGNATGSTGNAGNATGSIGNAGSAMGSAGAGAAPVKPEVSFADFEKIDLRVGVVESCELVPKSSKLLKLVIDAGALGKRTIFSGIRGAYPDPAALVGKEVAFVANLAPRKMSVGVSEGMVLFAGTPGEGGGVVSPDSPAGGGATVS